MECSTACAIATWPVRSVPPIASTAAASSVVTSGPASSWAGLAASAGRCFSPVGTPGTLPRAADATARCRRYRALPTLPRGNTRTSATADSWYRHGAGACLALLRHVRAPPDLRHQQPFVLKLHDGLPHRHGRQVELLGE